MWRHARYLFGRNEIGDEGKPRLPAMRQLENAEASHLDLAGDRLRRRGDKASVASRLDPYLIVGHEPRLQVLLGAKRKKAECEVRLAAARAAAQQGRVRAERHAGAMDELALRNNGHASSSGKANHKAGATAFALGGADALAARGVTLMETVLRPQPPAMGDHDLPRNIEA
jgi:hypothetical protein